MFKKFAVTVALATLATTAFAAEPGVYIGVDLGRTYSSEDGSDGSATSKGIFGGYDFGKNVAVEVALRTLFNVYEENANAKLTQTSLSVIGKLPLSEQFNVYGRLGYNKLKGDIRVDGDHFYGSKYRPLFGLGTSYEFTPGALLRAEFQKTAFNARNVNVAFIVKF